MAISGRAHWPGNKKSPFHQWKRPVFPCSPRQDPCRYRSRPAATVHGRYSGSAPGFRPSRCQWHMKEAGMRALRRRVRSRFSRDSLLTPAGSGDHGRATLGRELRLVNVWRKEGDAGLVTTACGCCRCPQLRDRRFPQGRDDTRQYIADGVLAWRAVAQSRAAAAPRAKKVFSSTRSITATGTVGARRFPAHKKDRPKAALAISRYSLAGAVCSPRRLSCRRTKTARKDHALPPSSQASSPAC